MYLSNSIFLFRYDKEGKDKAEEDGGLVPESWDEGGEDAQEGRTVSAKLKPNNGGDDDEAAAAAAKKKWDSDEWDATRPSQPAAPPQSKGSSSSAAAAAAAREMERKRQDELAAAAAQLSDYSEGTQRSVTNVDESLLNYDLIEQLLGSIIRTERSAGETALVAPSANAGGKSKKGGGGVASTPSSIITPQSKPPQPPPPFLNLSSHTKMCTGYSMIKQSQLNE